MSEEATFYYECQQMQMQMQMLNVNSQPGAVSRTGNHQSLAAIAGVSNKQSVPPGANSQQTMTSTGNNNQLASAPALRGKKVPFGMLLPVILPQLDKDRAMQLNTIYIRLRKNEIPKEDFFRHTKSIVGDQMLRMAVYKLQSQAARSAQNMPHLAARAQARGKKVPFGMLLPVIQPQLDKDRAMQLNTIYNRLRKNEIPKEDFVRHVKNIVGDQMLKMAVYKLQSQAARSAQIMPHLAVQAQAQAQAHAHAHAQAESIVYSFDRIRL